MKYSTGTISSITSPARSAGGVGRGWARAGKAPASRSRAEWPLLRSSREEISLPCLSMTNRIYAPRRRAVTGQRRNWFKRVETAPSQLGVACPAGGAGGSRAIRRWHLILDSVFSPGSGGRPFGRFRVNSIGMMHRLALQGVGIAVFAEEVAEEDVAAGRLRRVLPEWEAVYAVTETKLLPAKTQRFIEFLQQCLRQR